MTNIIQKMKIRYVLAGISSIKAVGLIYTVDLHHNTNKSSFYVSDIIIKETELTGKAASRMSNKRKKTKNQ